MNKEKPIWDVDEETNFIYIKSSLDGLLYKVYDTDREQHEDTVFYLAIARYYVNMIMLYLAFHSDEWKKNFPGIKIALDLHFPHWKKFKEGQSFNTILLSWQRNKHGFDWNNIMNKFCFTSLFPFMEMTPNKHGIIGLNKPKKLDKNNKIAIKRSFHLTVRNRRGITSIKTFMDLVIHELSHSACNDIVWKDDNHKDPFGSYNTYLLNIFNSLPLLKPILKIPTKFN
jgi:hypothetical protein